MITRRCLVTGSAAIAALLAAAPISVASTAPARPRRDVLTRDVFTLGVASGDPLPDSVVLWTRLAPDPLGGGGTPSFVGTSISSDFPAGFIAQVTAALPDNPHTKFVDGAFRGYVRCDVKEGTERHARVPNRGPALR